MVYSFYSYHLVRQSLKWLTTVGSCLRWGVNRQRRYPPLKSYLKVVKILRQHHQPQ